tara:strand:+ start:35455 stop:35898 length:444 start_codon:yes stop_codon:yes gene_type:complete
MGKSKQLVIITFFLIQSIVFLQNYYTEYYKPFNNDIPSPEEFLGYPMGDSYTRHDLVIAYIEKLAELSNRATIEVYGRTNENRKLIMLTITSSKNHKNLASLKEKYLQVVDEKTDITDYSSLPVFVNLGYNVHGNETSSTEAVLLIH